jgi:eukaryotic-like serine/threonine-protein kinase
VPENLKVCTKCRSQVGGYFQTCPYDGAELKPIPEAPLVGKVFADRYDILSILGEGGMSIVYKARHRLMNRIVAIKLLSGSMIGDGQGLERFKQEARAVSLLTHPNIIAVHDFGIIDEVQAYLVMDYLDGTNLARVVENEGALPAERAVRIFRQVCEGLEHAHNKGIVHRDLKPSNLCLIKGKEGAEVVKIVDFGLAKMVKRDSADSLQLTQSGQVWGSPLFMSPEQCLAKPLDARSDIYSLGCVMYYTLTGVHAINGITAYDTISKHVNERPKEFHEVAPQIAIDKNIEAVVFRCLEKEPDDRYQSASDMLADLPKFAADTGSLVVKAVEHPLKTRLRFQIFRLGFFTLLSFVSVALLYEALDKGPSNDRGTILQKTLWNSETTLAQSLMNAHNYNMAQTVLSWGENQAREWEFNRGRQRTILTLQRELYKRARMFEEFDAVNKKLAQLDEAALLEECKSTTREIDELDHSTSDVSQRVNRILAELFSQNIIHTAKGLSGFRLDEQEEELLKRAMAVDSKLLEPDHPVIAELSIHLADCYLREQETYKVRHLLADAQRIYRNAVGENDKKTIYATLRLGQFDRDENNFELAKLELESALTKAKEYCSSDTYLNSQCLNSYADFLQQTGHPEHASQVFAEAAAVEERSSH